MDVRRTHDIAQHALLTPGHRYVDAEGCDETRRWPRTRRAVTAAGTIDAPKSTSRSATGHVADGDSPTTDHLSRSAAIRVERKVMVGRRARPADPATRRVFRGHGCRCRSTPIDRGVSVLRGSSRPRCRRRTLSGRAPSRPEGSGSRSDRRVVVSRSSARHEGHDMVCVGGGVGVWGGALWSCLPPLTCETGRRPSRPVLGGHAARRGCCK